MTCSLDHYLLQQSMDLTVLLPWVGTVPALLHLVDGLQQLRLLQLGTALIILIQQGVDQTIIILIQHCIYLTVLLKLGTDLTVLI